MSAVVLAHFIGSASASNEMLGCAFKACKGLMLRFMWRERFSYYHGSEGSMHGFATCWYDLKMLASVLYSAGLQNVSTWTYEDDITCQRAMAVVSIHQGGDCLNSVFRE